MKLFQINYTTGLLTFFPQYREIQAENKETAIALFNAYKRHNETFCGISELPLPESKRKDNSPHNEIDQSVPPTEYRTI